MHPLQGISSPIDRKHSRGLTTDLIEGVSTAFHSKPTHLARGGQRRFQRRAAVRACYAPHESQRTRRSPHDWIPRGTRSRLPRS